jgi:hypothetical protein
MFLAPNNIYPPLDVQIYDMPYLQTGRLRAAKIATARKYPGPSILL